MNSKKLIRFSVGVARLVAISALSSTAYAQNYRVDVEKGVMPCHYAAAYNNTNRNVMMYVDFEYKGADGSYHNSRTQFVAGAGQKTTSYMPGHTVDCDKRYTVRITNWQAR